MTGQPSTPSAPNVQHVQHPTFSPNPLGDSPSTPLPRRRSSSTHAHGHTHDPHAAAPSPIIAKRTLDEAGGGPSAVPPTPRPQYAEDLTPLKLRHKRRKHVALPSSMSVLPLTPGVSKLGWMTEEGEVYRGAKHDPRSDAPAIEDDAITLGGSSSSSSSGWSLPSAVERTFERFGEVIGVRRGSHSSDDTDSTSSSSIRSGVFRRRSRRLSRSTTRGSSPERPRRQHLPRKREFTLLLPPKEGTDITTLSRVSTVQSLADSSPSSNASYPHDRLVVTPSLPIVLDKIRSLRALSGIRADTPTIGPDIPVRRGGSAPGRTRQKTRPGQQATFANPAFSRPPNPRTQSRLQALRGNSSTDVPRPKSVSDLMGMANPYSSSNPSLASLKNIDYKMPSRAGTPVSVSNSEVLAKHKDEAMPCWWLDVACPTWEDLRDIGELLGLHPLTLEDVLQQDPREKLDTFVKLGYYFVVVRALDEGYFKYTPGSATTLVGKGETVVMEGPGSPELPGNSEKKKEGRRRGWGMGRASGRNADKEGEKVEIVEDNPGKEGLEGVGVGALNVYLVVFADGIVSFHYDDVSKHTKRVLDRILSSTSVKAAPGADWVAHGLLDSIVDAFFPLIRYVDGEVDDIDSLTIDPSADPKAQSAARVQSPSSSLTHVASPSSGDIELMGMEKGAVIRSEPVEPLIKRSWRNFTSIIPSYTIHVPRPLQYVRLFLLPTTSAVHRQYEHPDDKTHDRAAMVHHITSMRKLVTGLTRLLGAKGQVVGEMRKRAVSSGEGVDAYMGDVEDHILLLQNSLYHYEYILSHCQPAYLSHLSLSFKIAKGRSDQSILALSVVAIGILPMQLVTTAFGMNVQVPQNGVLGDPAHRADGSVSPLNWFIGILGFLILLICGLVTTIRYWRWAARKKWAQRRNRELPSDWDGFWGWR